MFDISRAKCFDLDIQDSFFDSLKEDYQDFSSWFHKISHSNRECFVSFENNNIQGLAIFKKEHNPIISLGKANLLGDYLKLCTLKSNSQGAGLGEALFHKIFKEAINSNCNGVYLTIHPYKHKKLHKLIKSLGFVEYGIDLKKRDIVFFKNLK